jgi:hypothetical protein
MRPLALFNKLLLLIKKKKIYAFQEDVFLLLGFVGQNWVFVLISEVDIYPKRLAQVVRALVFVVVP